MNNILSICIPTYNRAEKLRGCIEHLIPQIVDYDIPIYVSDNASKDHTSEVIEELKNTYKYIYYSRNEENFGFDYNFTKVLKMSDSQYSWLLSDDDRVVKSAISDVLSILNYRSYDLVVLNGGQLSINSSGDFDILGRVKNISSKIYYDKNELLVELGWHMTWISCLIFCHDVIRKGQFDKYQNTSLVHVGAVFDYLADKDISVYWFEKPCLYGISTEILPSWVDKIFEIWVYNWFELVNSLPLYSKEAKFECIKNHGMQTSLFNSWRSFYNLRKLGYYNYSIYRKYYNYLKHVTDVPLYLLFIISIAPNFMIALSRKLTKAIAKL
ncbi:MAG: hypothetical protein CXR31_04710 [Geobacter sp.]|nr:MAG: hypothetical protein CXR31_04710 [Geobacter sp.]